MWAGRENDIPAAWALCNGQNGTPDWYHRGFDSGKYTGIDTGGKDEFRNYTEVDASIHINAMQ